MFKVNLKKENSKKGFTLIEMLVSVAIFSIVVVISLGAILTILDANRKARTLTEVMNNMNFSVEAITRSLKTGVEPEEIFTDGGTLIVKSIILDESGFKREITRYKFVNPVGPNGMIVRCVNTSSSCSSDEWQPITSELVDINSFDFNVIEGCRRGDCTSVDGIQPRTQFFISGEVKINEKISSDFSLQTTVSQRRLNLPGSESDIQG